MKKFVLVLSLIMLLGMSVVNAEIREEVDQVTGAKRYTSSNHSTSQQTIDLRKIVEDHRILYGLLVSEDAVKTVKFSLNNGEIKIDNKLVSPIIIAEISSTPIANSDLSSIRLNAVITPEQIEAIRLANNVTFTFHKNDGTSSVIVLPDNVLAEWKKLIGTDKSVQAHVHH